MLSFTQEIGNVTGNVFKNNVWRTKTMKRKRVTAVLLTTVMTMGLLVGCGSGSKSSDASSNEGSVYFLNFKPEVAEVWEDIAEDYTEETGVKVKVQTAASGTYEQTLKSEMAKKDAPTLFQINGQIGYQTWQQYCADWSDTDIYSHLINKDLAIKGEDGEGVYGLPYVVEGYGILYNDEIMQKYFALSDKAVDISSADEIKNFDTLKAVVEDMQNKKDELGIEGVFASTSLKAGEDWRWQTHTMNVPVYYEYKDDNVQDKDKLEFTYSDNFKNIFDLYLNNSCTDPKQLGAKSVDDSMAEFALGKVAMVQNGNWAWNQIKGVDGNTVTEDNIKYLPIYTGVEGEENQGLCIGTEGFWCINSKASEADQQATLDFIDWVFSSDKGKEYVINELGFISPFDTFGEDEVPNDPLAKIIKQNMDDDSLTSLGWVYTTFPSQTWKDDFGASLLEYAQGTKKWDDVKKDAVEEWATEKEALQ